MTKKVNKGKIKNSHPASGLTEEEFNQIKEGMQQEVNANKRILDQKKNEKQPVLST